MKVVHWSSYVGSGMDNVARSLVKAEKELGLDSYIVNTNYTNSTDWEKYVDSNIHVNHTHFPYDQMRKNDKAKVVWVSHGVPEHLFTYAVEQAKFGYGHGDPWMLFQFWLQHADARVTFWPRHQAIMQTLVDRSVPIHLVELGVDLAFWQSGDSQGKYTGKPAVWTGEACHPIKWPLDLFLLWPWVAKEFPEATLHVNMLTAEFHRWFFPLVNRNGVSYRSHISSVPLSQSQLANTLKSVDYQIGLVNKGDFNLLSLEANATGAQTISYADNPYSSYHVTEGDQRATARDLVAIFKGDVEPRARTPVADISVTAAAMKGIYESLLG